MKRLLPAVLASLVAACGADADPDDATPPPAGGKADEFADVRVWEVLLTDPHCDVCSADDKQHLLETSTIVPRLLELIEGAQTSIEIAQFTWSNRDLEAAVLAAAGRPGLTVRVAMNQAQEQGDTVSRRLADAGVDVHFVAGRDNGSFAGLQHAKFMRVDGKTLAMGSNNWSSTGLSINNENTVIVTSDPNDTLLQAFGCYFDAMFDGRIDDGPECSTQEVKFTPSSVPSAVLRDEFRAAEESIDVLMHHLLFDKTIKELTKAAVAGRRVRVLVNAADRDEISGSLWDAFLAAGGEVRFKQTNADAFQIMHHKLAVVDDRILLNGSGNWSGSGFFNNYEFYLRAEDPDVVAPFDEAFERLWQWSLTADSLDAGRTAAAQDADATEVFFGNLHAHYEHVDGDRILDDGANERQFEDGETRRVDDEFDHGDGARFAFEYARDTGVLDFMALSPHVVDDRADDPADVPNMSEEGFARMRETATAVTRESDGTFVAMASMEWSTNSTGNHVGILGSSVPCKATRGAFDELFDEFLPVRAAEGDDPLVMFNHPRTFRHHEDTLEGNWDQVFGVNLLEIPKPGDRSKKFNDFGLDDYDPLRSVRDAWIAGEAEPDPSVVAQTHAAIRAAADPYARLMEVTVARGTELGSEEAQNPSLSEDEAGNLVRFTKVHSDWDYYLSQGYRLAPVANHDNHLANWGAGHTSRTAIVADRLDERTLLAALRDRAVYASEDENLEIRAYVDGRVRSGQAMTTLADGIELSVHLSDPDFAGQFEVTVFHGRVGAAVEAVQTVVVPAAQWESIAVSVPEAGEHFVYLEVREPEADAMAWTAPVWVHRP